MKSSRFICMAVTSLCLVVFASFTLKNRSQTSLTPYAEKILVFKVSYDETNGKLTASEKLGVSSDMIQRNSEGKIAFVNKDAILSQMPMASRVIMQSMVSGKPATEMYALVSYKPAEGDKLSMAPSDEQLFDYAKKSYDSFVRNSFSGTDFSVSGENFNCAGSSCNVYVPAGVEVFVWHQK